MVVLVSADSPSFAATSAWRTTTVTSSSSPPARIGAIGGAAAARLVARPRPVPLRLAALADAARVDGRARFCHVASTDGSFTANLPVDEALASGLVLYELDGAELPASFGGPFRLLFPDSQDCSVNVKFLGELRFLEQPGSHTARCAEEEDGAV